jgi:hypothetical protein
VKLIIACSILAAALGGCVGAPVGYGDNPTNYYRDRGYTGDGYRNRDYYRGDEHYRDYSYRNERRNPADPFVQHGN